MAVSNGTRLWLFAAVLTVAAVLSVRGGQEPAPVAGAAPTGRSVWDGVYTKEQAGRGKELYATHCLACHGEEREGHGPARALTGPEVAANWNGLSLGDMLDRTRASRPMVKPGTGARQP